MCTINTLCAQSAHYVHNQKSAYQLHLPADVDQYGEADYCKGYVQWKSGRHLLVSLIIIISMISINTITDILLQKMPFLDQRHKIEMVIPKILELLVLQYRQSSLGGGPRQAEKWIFLWRPDKSSSPSSPSSACSPVSEGCKPKWISPPPPLPCCTLTLSGWSKRGSLGFKIFNLGPQQWCNCTNVHWHCQADQKRFVGTSSFF